MTGQRISRALNQDRKTNQTTAANMGSLTSHKMTVSKTSITTTETNQGNDTAGKMAVDQGSFLIEPTYRHP